MNVEAIGLLTKLAIYALASSLDTKYGPWDRFIYASCYVKRPLSPNQPIQPLWATLLIDSMIGFHDEQNTRRSESLLHS